jgi:hypothetical protein
MHHDTVIVDPFLEQYGASSIARHEHHGVLRDGQRS